eukprot:COSAG01_NODE_67_length_29188_cov_1135.609474_10_plen_262_part_00
MRFVVHHDMPKSPEAMVQESGRAGRDGRPAQSRVYFDEDDLQLFQFLASKQANEGRQQQELDRLQSVADLCTHAGCLRAQLLRCFGEAKPAGVAADQCCSFCERQSLDLLGGSDSPGHCEPAAAHASGSHQCGGATCQGGGFVPRRDDGLTVRRQGARGTRRAASFSRGTGIASTRFKPPRRLHDDDEGSGGGGGGGSSGASATHHRGSGDEQVAQVGTGAELIQFARRRAQPLTRAPLATARRQPMPQRAGPRATRVDLF